MLKKLKREDVMRNKIALARLMLSGAIVAAAMMQSGVALAQGKAPAADSSNDGADIVVTARRADESLQNVPLVVNAVGGETLNKLNIQKFENVTAVVPGLSMASIPQGYGYTMTLRGASYSSDGGGDPNVETYVNDAYTPGFFMFQSMYDIGQVEVLRGPQGTLRGRASPAGSITLTTKRPDLNEVGGMVDATANDRHGFNGSAAINIPLIKDVLGVRLAGLYNQGRYTEVRSVSSPVMPGTETRSGRISVLFKPSDSFKASVVYQVLQHKNTAFQPVESIQISQPGYPLSSIGTGPVIRASDRLGITDGNISLNETQKILNLQAEWTFAGQKLSYVGSRIDWQGDTNGPQDPANVLRPGEVYQPNHTDYTGWSHEIRLSSVDRIAGMFDYTIGYFRDRRIGINNLLLSNVLPAQTFQTRHEDSVFGNLTLHLGEATEISGGLRHITFHEPRNDFTIPGFGLKVDFPANYSATVYNASISHRFSDDFMVYANTGSSWRTGFFSISVLRSLTPNLTDFLNLKPESSKSYEIGFKSTLMDKKLRFNAAYFHQDYKNFQYRNGSPVNYINIGTAGEVVDQHNFFANIPAKVDGVEVEVGYRPSEHFSVDANFAWAKGIMKNGRIPCTDVNGDGIPDTGLQTVAQIKSNTGGDAVAACTLTQRINFAPDWNLSVVPEYSVPVSSSASAFVRGLFTYNPSTANDPNNPFDDIPSYGMLDLFLGLRSSNGAWEVSAYGKNIFNTFRVTTRSSVPLTSFGSADPTYGLYVPVTFTAPREFGVSLRYAFGSR